jgi:hypothetical protein
MVAREELGGRERFFLGIGNVWEYFSTVKEKWDERKRSERERERLFSETAGKKGKL